MAFLKETERSLRMYFIVAGAIATLLALAGIGEAGNLPAAAPAIWKLAIWLPLLARLVLGLAFVIAGINLRRALENGAAGTKQLVKFASAVVIAEVVLLSVAANSVAGEGNAAELMGKAVGSAIIPLLILWYIYNSLRRLSAESQRRIVDTVAGKFD